MYLPKLLLIVHICLARCVLSLSMVQGGKVDRLVSQRRRLSSRGAGSANGGKSDSHNGHDGCSKNFELSFYHINDVHAHLEEFRTSGSACTNSTQGCVGGYARVKTIFDTHRPAKPNSLFLNAGDEFQGTLFYTLYKGEKIAETLNQLGFDAMTLGNHEFDDGDDLLSDFLNNLTFPIISSNIHSKHPKLAQHLIPYKIFPQYSLAVLALTTPDTAIISNPSNLTTFEDPVTATQRTVELIKGSHPTVHHIVALTHIGYYDDIRLAQNTTGISLIIGGHSHTPLGDMAGAAGPYPTIVNNPDGDEVFVVTAYRWGEYLGYIDVEYDARGKIMAYEGAPIHLTNTTALEPHLESEIKEWEKAFDVFEKTIIGFTQNSLLSSTCEQGECNLGDLTADALEAYRPGPVAAIMNAGGIRIDIDAGNITQQQALDCFPFGNAYVQLNMTGMQIWDAFEGIVSKINIDNGQPVQKFVQVSKNIRFTYNPSNPTGSRLITLSVTGQPVALSQTYLIATTDFVASGGDNFWPARTDYAILETVDIVFSDYVVAQSPLDYHLDGRIATTADTTPRKGTQLER